MLLLEMNYKHLASKGVTIYGQSQVIPEHGYQRTERKGPEHQMLRTQCGPEPLKLEVQAEGTKHAEHNN